MGAVNHELREMARKFAKGSIVTEATARLIEQVLLEAHECKIAPLQQRVADLEAEIERCKFVGLAGDLASEVLEYAAGRDLQDHLAQPRAVMLTYEMDEDLVHMMIRARDLGVLTESAIRKMRFPEMK